MRAPQSPSLRQHPLILPVYLPTFLISFAGGILSPILPLYLREFDVSYGLVGMVLSAQAIGMLVMDIPSGMILRRLGQRNSMIAGLGLVAISTTLLFWAGSIPEALLYRLLSGVGFSIFAVSRHAYIAESAPLEVRGRSVALFGGINRIGRFSGPAIGGLVGSALSLRTPFLLTGFLMGMAFILVVILLPKTTATQRHEGGSVKSFVNAMWKTARHYRQIFATVGAGQLLAQLVRTGRDVFIPLYGADVLQLGVDQIGWISSMASAVDMLLFYPVGMVMDRFGRKFAIVPSFFVQGLGLGLIPFAGNFTGLAMVAVLIGFGNGLGSGTMMTLGADLAPKNLRGEFLGIWRLIGDTGSMLGPAVAGAVATSLALTSAAVVVGGCGVAASLIFLFLVPETANHGPS